MKAVVLHKARDLRIEDREPPSPGPGEVEVAVRRGGICGSDLHYYHHGAIGEIRLREPIVLGHEVAGEVVALGPGTEGFAPGDVVAVDPSLPCHACAQCRTGRQNHCTDMRFFGSAMRMPHVQGGFQQTLVVAAARCHAFPAGVSLEEAAFCEPLAVVLHGLARAGSIAGQRVLVTGCGPIGALAILAARLYGAREIVATDVTDFTLRTARDIGADRALDMGADPGALQADRAGADGFDVMIEASGVAAALGAGLRALAPRGVVVQLGLGGEMTLPMGLIVAREIEIRGAFRFVDEFADAADLIARRQLDLMPLLSEVVPFADAAEALARAGDRTAAIKVQIAF